jgi:hypothetical protein
MPFEMFELQDQDETGEFKNAYLDFMQQNHTFDDTFMDRKKDKKKKKLTNLDDFIEGDSDDQIGEGLDS